MLPLEVVGGFLAGPKCQGDENPKCRLLSLDTAGRHGALSRTIGVLKAALTESPCTAVMRCRAVPR